MQTFGQDLAPNGRFALEAKVILSNDNIGCYGWYWLGEYLYIGKSKKIGLRAWSHLPIMVRRLGQLPIREVEIHFWECSDIFQAGLLEGKLIVRHKPKYNRDYTIS